MALYELVARGALPDPVVLDPPFKIDAKRCFDQDCIPVTNDGALQRAAVYTFGAITKPWVFRLLTSCCDPRISDRKMSRSSLGAALCRAQPACLRGVLPPKGGCEQASNQLQDKQAGCFANIFCKWLGDHQALVRDPDLWPRTKDDHGHPPGCAFVPPPLLWLPPATDPQPLRRSPILQCSSVDATAYNTVARTHEPGGTALLNSAHIRVGAPSGSSTPRVDCG